MPCKQNQILKSSHKKPILYDLYYSDAQNLNQVIVFCHGYKGFKDWGAWHLVAEDFAESGFCFLKFNFSHNGGTLENPIDFPDLEAFAQNNFSMELDDLDRILNFVTREIQPETISLVAHSRSSGVALIKAEEDPRVTNVITWAGVCDFKLLFQEDTESFKTWKITGRAYVENTRTKQQMPHDWQFYEDFRDNEERLTISRAVKNLGKPQLIIHGSDDTTVSAEMAQLLHRWNPKSKLVIIDGADHVFGASHPWVQKDLPEDLKLAVDVTRNFLK